MNDSNSNCSGFAAKTRKTTVHLGYWTLAWVATTAVAAFGPKLVWDFATLPTVLGVLVNIVVGFGMILATRRASIDDPDRIRTTTRAARAAGTRLHVDDTASPTRVRVRRS